MKTLILILFISLFSSCDIFESSSANPILLHTMKVENIQVEGNKIRVDVILSTPTPCYYFYSSEVTKNDSSCIVKIYGDDNGATCSTVLDSIKHVQEIFFSTSGQKKLRFYRRYEGDYLDTLININ